MSETYMRKFCKICEKPEYRAELKICPLCGALGDKPYLEMITRQLYEEYYDRLEDHRVFGTPMPLIN
jgi:hypothetical protein